MGRDWLGFGCSQLMIILRVVLTSMEIGCKRLGLSSVWYDWATGPMDRYWLGFGFGNGQVMIILRLGLAKTGG